jgi:hypothetical protein
MNVVAALLVAAGAQATEIVSVLMDEAPRPEYRHGGSVYVEAVRGREFAIRLTNPTSSRVAVALSVDGLNTIDARHSDAWSAMKWVLEPYESTVISGWQVNQRTARRFFFTGERHSYGAALGQTENLGVIEAVVYAERRPRFTERFSLPGGAAKEESESAAAPPPSPKAGALSDDYAATGMGDRTRHEVEQIHIDLDPRPVATARIRYEFRPELVRLGVIPHDVPSPMERRERARGFEGFCPEP